MKKIYASILLALVSLQSAAFGCDGGTSGFDLPPPPPPTPLESVVNSVSNNAVLFIGLALGTLIGAAVARQRRFAAAKAPRPLENPVV